MAEDVARVVALAWGAEAAPQRGPKRELSLERVVEAAVEIADAEGLGAVTMQRVARSFGYTTMAMYRYVATKDDLHQLMLDAAVRGPVVVDADDWRTGLQQWCRWMVEVYAAHPWVLDIPVSMHALLMPEQMRVADAALRAMRTLPASPEERLLVLMGLSTFVRGHATLARDVAGPSGVVSRATAELVREVATVGRFPDLAPLVASGSYLGPAPEVAAEEGTPEDDLGLGLAIWLEGVAATFEQRGAGSAPTSAAPEPTDPAEALEVAEAELRALSGLRADTQRRVRELERREASLRKARDRAKEVAKAAARLARG